MKDINEIIKLFSNNGLNIENPEIYQNIKTKFNCYDELGYRYSLSTVNVKSSNSYAKFQKRNPHTVENIKLWLKLNDPDYELLSDEYNGNEAKLEWRKKSRSDLPSFHTSWHMFYSDGNRHPLLRIEAQANSKRRKPEQVRFIVEEKLKGDHPDWSLNIGEEYKYVNPDSKLKFTHIEGYKSTTLFDTLLLEGRKGLDLFRTQNPEDSIHNVKLWTHKNSKYELKDGQTYSHFRSKYIFICNIHGEFENNFCTIYSYNTGCQKCIQESHLGEGNPNWNQDLTDKERNYKRLIEGYSEWRLSVYERDKYTCQCCESNESGKLKAHHLNSYHWAKDERIDIDNGITLCEDCHKDFHRLYGYRNNTKEQFQEYVDSMQNNVG